ncbi:MAG TPA: NAD(P)/FAD-dependent oxidoreductase [Kofleriaceae bacterium]|jgi:monoamine oxidase
MARSALMGFLKSLVGAHAEADRRNLPIEAIREEQEQVAEQQRTGVGRRQILMGAVAGAAMLALPRRARAAPAPRIAVIGAGISGTTAALTLQDAGYASTVYESSARIGGRMFSNNAGYWTDNQVSEWCGELIDTAHVTIQALAKRFNLPLDDGFSSTPSGATETYYYTGQYYPKDQADADFKPVYAKLRSDRNAANYPTTYNSSTAAGVALDKMSIYDWIESRVPGGHTSQLGKLLDTAYEIEYGASTREQSSLNLVYLLGYQPNSSSLETFGRSNERYHIRGGNQLLPLAVAGALNTPIQLNMRLIAIAKASDGSYTLTFRSGNTTKTVTADLVVLTVPFAVMSGIDTTKAGFDTLKDSAIANLGRGRNGKLQLQYTSRLWNTQGPWGLGSGTSYSDVGYQTTWEVSRAQPGASGILVNYTGGGTTLAMQTKVAYATVSTGSVKTDATNFLTKVEKVFPGLTSRWNTKATSSLPHLDPNFGCSYSFWKVGQVSTIAGYERVRQGNIFFAGEHCSLDFQGFMEGGASEGKRAAAEIIAQLK